MASPPVRDQVDGALGAEYLPSDPNGPEIQLASMIVDQQLEAEAVVAGVMNPDPQQFVKFPVNVLEWRRHLSATKWTVLSVIHDKIARWDKESDAVSNSQIAAETTLSESSIRRAIAEMNTTDGPIDVVTLGTRGIPVYRVRPCDRCQSDTPVNLTPLPPIGCQPDTPPTTIGVNLTPTTDVVQI